MRAVPTIEHLDVIVPLDPYLGLRALATYSGMSIRTLRSHIDGQPDVALPCYRVNGRVLVRRSEFDGWMRQFQARGRPSLALAVAALGLKATPAVERHHVR